MATTPGKENLEKSGLDAVSLPPHPGEEAYAHEGAAWLEAAERRLGELKLLGVARGRMPPTAAAYRDYDLDELPLLPDGHPHAEQRKEKRLIFAAHA